MTDRLHLAHKCGRASDGALVVHGKTPAISRYPHAARNAPKQEVQALLHRAAISLQNANSSPNELTLDDALSAAAKDMMLSRQDLVPRILREWLHIKGYLNDSAFNLDERTKTS